MLTSYLVKYWRKFIVFQLKSEVSQSTNETDKSNFGEKNSSDTKQSSPTNGGKGEAEGSTPDKNEDPLVQVNSLIIQ